MRWRGVYTSAAVSAAVLLSSPGCRSTAPAELFSASLWNPFGLRPLFSVNQEPVRIGTVCDDQSIWDVRAWWDLRDRTPWLGFRTELGQYIRRPVQVVQLKPFQVAAQLESGRLQFAMLSDAQLAEVTAESKSCQIVAYADAIDDTGLIVASAKSDVDSLEKVAGQRFAFGPCGHPLLHYGAAAELEQAGVTMDQIKRELVPLGALQYHISSREAAKEVAYGTTTVGVILRSEYLRYPQTGGRFLPLSFSKDQFRVLGETAPINFGPFIASESTDAKLVQSVRSFLVSAAKKRPWVTESLGIAAFSGADPNRM